MGFQHYRHSFLNWVLWCMLWGNFYWTDSIIIPFTDILLTGLFHIYKEWLLDSFLMITFLQESFASADFLMHIKAWMMQKWFSTFIHRFFSVIKCIFHIYDFHWGFLQYELDIFKTCLKLLDSFTFMFSPM